MQSGLINHIVVFYIRLGIIYAMRLFPKFVHHDSCNTIYPFILYKRISEQYNNKDILNVVKGLIPYSILKLYYSDQDLKAVLRWFKADFMMWMPEFLKCKKCDSEMDSHVIIWKFMEITRNRDLFM
jgi:hypothetical protein